MADPRQVIPFSPRASGAKPAEITLDKLSLKRRGLGLLNGLSLSLPAEGVTAIVGPNGAGKSLALRVIAGLTDADSGRIALPHAMRGRIGLVFQRPILLRRSARANLIHALKLARIPRSERVARTIELLALCGLTEKSDRPARHLSGGEQQRLAIVRALAANPLLLMLDEPTAHLDPQSTHAIETLILRIAAQGAKVILVTHDIGQVDRLADDVAFLHQGKAHELTAKSQFLSRPNSPAARAYLDGKLLL